MIYNLPVFALRATPRQAICKLGGYAAKITKGHPAFCRVALLPEGGGGGGMGGARIPTTFPRPRRGLRAGFSESARCEFA